MSIWCSWPHIGTAPNQWQDMTGKPMPKKAERGVVLSYAQGFSNHHPDLTGTHERPALIALASIAPWCVPGHDEDCSTCDGWHDEEVGPWLRLEVVAPETVNFWQKDSKGNPQIEEEGATVVLNRKAVKALRDDLTRWLKLDHLEPIEESA